MTSPNLNIEQQMTPTEYYQQGLLKPDFEPDPVQAEVVKILQRSFDALNQSSGGEKEPSSPISLYLWGKVGRGKTFLMDAFYHCIEHPQKQRVHFYRFMQDVHRRLAEIQGCSDPLITVANQIAEQTQVLCFDEFFVSDIGDAMLLSGLIRQLFANGVVIIATSNVVPDDLYKGGLQRIRFMPAIKAIEDNMQVVHMDGLVDHRLRTLSQLDAYFLLSEATASEAMFKHFSKACNEAYSKGGEVIIEHRPINYAYKAENAIWFDFEQICKGARSQNDYIALASLYDSVYIENVPQMGGSITQRNIAQGTEDGAIGSDLAKLNLDRQRILQDESKTDDEARRFISLVDELYDRKVRLYLSSRVAITELYLGGRLTFEFERAVSRLLEMQSVDYFEACQ
jgi:cell division protein ZapE